MDNVRAYLQITQARPTVGRTIFANATSDTQPDETCHQFSAPSNYVEWLRAIVKSFRGYSSPKRRADFPAPGHGKPPARLQNQTLTVSST